MSGIRNARNTAIAAAAESFVRAHAELEVLAQEIGPEAASQSDLNNRVIALHAALELLILGALPTPGRRSSPTVGPTTAYYRCEHPGCDGSIDLVHAQDEDQQPPLSELSLEEVANVVATRTERALKAIEAAAVMLHWARIEVDGNRKLYCIRHARDTICAGCRSQDCLCPGGPSLDRLLVIDEITS